MTFTGRNEQDFSEIFNDDFDDEITAGEMHRCANDRRRINLALRHPDEQIDEIEEWDDE